jgi:hypothetical protein
VLSKQPAIAAAIAEYEAQLLPLADVRAEKLNALRSLKNLALSPYVLDKIRLAAATKLYEICSDRERLEARELPRSPSLNVDHLINEILQELRRAGAKGLALEKVHEGSSLAAKERETEL